MMDNATLEILATYNAERARGIVHTQLWRNWMAELQAEFDKERKAKFAAVANG